MSAEDKDMTEQQFNKYWKEISQLLTDFGYDVNMLTGLKTDNQLNEDQKKILDHIKGKVEEKFLFFLTFSKNNTKNKLLTDCS